METARSRQVDASPPNRCAADEVCCGGRSWRDIQFDTVYYPEALLLLVLKAAHVFPVCLSCINCRGRGGSRSKSRCFLKNVSQRSSENTHVCTCTDAELQRRKLFIWDERWSLKKNVLHPGETADFLKRKQTGRVGEGWKGKITKNKKGEKVNPPGAAASLTHSSVCLSEAEMESGVATGSSHLLHVSHRPAFTLKYWKQKLVQINGRLFLPFVYFNDSFCVYARFQNGTFTCVLKESSSLFFPFSPTRNNFLWSAFSRNLNLRI